MKLYKTFWKCNDNRVISKDLKLQNSNWSYVPTISCLWPPSFGKGISCSFLHRFEWWFLDWMCHLKIYKTFLKCKDNRVISKDLKLQNSNWSYVPTIPCLWPPSFGKNISCSFLHQFEWLFLDWMHHLKILKTFWKCKNNRVMSKNLKL